MCKVFLKNYESMNTYYQILLFENKLLIIYFINILTHLSEWADFTRLSFKTWFFH